MSGTTRNPKHPTLKSKWWLLLLAASVLTVFSRAQAVSADAGDYFTDVWSSENGLPDSSVTSIAQTPQGYLWVGTYNGLARFDGVRFVTFDPANTPELSHARIRKLFVDAQGTLWVNTYDGSLTTVRDGKFALENQRTKTSEAEVTLVSSSSNRVMFLTSRGNILRKTLTKPVGEGWEELMSPRRGPGALCCEDGNGTVWYRSGDKQLWRLVDGRFEVVSNEAVSGAQSVNCLTTDARGKLWFGTDRGFGFWDGSRFQTAMPTNGEGPVEVTALSVAADGNIWALADGCICEASGCRWLIAPDASRNILAGAQGRVGLQEDGHGGMWFYNYGRGLFHVSAAGEIRQLTAEDGFPGDRVYCFTEDWEGNWWAGLDAGGLARVRERQFHAVTAGEGAAVKAVKSVSEGDDGTVWLGELGGGLGCWREGKLTTLSLAERAGEDSVFCVCAGRDGRMWLSAGSEDLFAGKGTEFTRVSPVVHGVKAIMTDHTGRTWFGATSGLLFAEPGRPEEVQQFHGMGRRDVRALAEGRDGAIWAGTGNGEIYCVTGDTAKAFHPADSLGSAAIWSVLADQDGTVWAGTFRGGLLRFRDGKFTRFGKNEGLPDAIICQILDDGQGNLWMGSHLGIFRVAKSALSEVAEGRSKSVSCLAYGKSDGVPSVECTGGYQPSAWRGKDGKLWFTTLKGAAWIRPEDVRPNLKAPPVVIEDVMVDGVGNGSRGQGLEQSGNAALEIPPGKHQLEFRYTGLSLASSERVQFRYRMEGVDPDWVSAGTRRFAHYGFLPPGNYRFDVMACSSDGVWSEAGAALGLVILPHYYETIWFRVLAGVLVAGAVAGSVRYAVTRRLHRKLERLERQQAVERERARIAKDIHDDLGASLTLIAVLGDLAKRDKASERIERMSNTARQAVKSLDEIVWAVNPRNDTLAHLIDYTGQFATDYLRDAGIRCLLDVPDQTPVREVPANVRHNVFLAVKEALQNIVKHAHATQVWLRVAATPEDLRIDVEDNGQGFNGAPADASADGLGNMGQRLKEVGGDCRVRSLVGKGTAITIELPWPK